MGRCGSVTLAGRFCRAYEELRQSFRARTTMHERLALADQRHLFQERWAAVLTELAAT